MGLVDPHLLEFGNAGPGVSGGDAHRASRLVLDHKAEALAVTTPHRLPIVIVEIFFNRIDFHRREVVAGLDEGGHSDARSLEGASYHSSMRNTCLPIDGGKPA